MVQNHGLLQKYYRYTYNAYFFKNDLKMFSFMFLYQIIFCDDLLFYVSREQNNQKTTQLMRRITQLQALKVLLLLSNIQRQNKSIKLVHYPKDRGH